MSCYFLFVKANIVKKLEKITASMNGLVKLEAYQNRKHDDVQPLFDTWPVDKFCKYQQ